MRIRSAPASTAGKQANTQKPCPARGVLDRVGDKWSVYVIHALGSQRKRFSALRHEIDGISQRMLTVTLRGLERDGLVTRTIHAEVPPRVEYELTALGMTLKTTVDALLSWSESHRGEIDTARRRYDARKPT